MDERTADLCDQYADRIQILDPLFSHYGGLRKFSGLIETVSCFEDNSLVRECLSSPGNNRVLVVDAGGSRRRAMLGDQLATLAIGNHWRGVVINGMVRDTAEIRKMAVGVLALGTHPLKSEKRGRGEVGIPLHFADARLSPENYLYADEDGVIIAKQRLGE